MNRIGIVIPTLDAGAQFPKLLEQLMRQSCQVERCLVVDSSSEDGTREAALSHGCEVLSIARREFNHGRTRQQAFVYLQDSVDILVYITQDILFAADDSLERLVKALENQADAGAAYGRQLPYPGASQEARLQREFNYPPQRRVKSMADREALGIKTAFLSDSFAAYRCDALADVGGFPDVPACEDMYVGAKLLQAGYTIVYAAEAQVYHSHEYGLQENFHRYYVTGVFHKQQSWIRQVFGGSEGEGLRLLRYQLREARRLGGWLTAVGLLWDNGIRYAAYCLGKWFG